MWTFSCCFQYLAQNRIVFFFALVCLLIIYSWKWKFWVLRHTLRNCPYGSDISLQLQSCPHSWLSPCRILEFFSVIADFMNPKLNLIIVLVCMYFIGNESTYFLIYFTLLDLIKISFRVLWPTFLEEFQHCLCIFGVLEVFPRGGFSCNDEHGGTALDILEIGTPCSTCCQLGSVLTFNDNGNN